MATAIPYSLILNKQEQEQLKYLQSFCRTVNNYWINLTLPQREGHSVVCNIQIIRMVCCRRFEHIKALRSFLIQMQILMWKRDIEAILQSGA